MEMRELSSCEWGAHLTFINSAFGDLSCRQFGIEHLLSPRSAEMEAGGDPSYHPAIELNRAACTRQKQPPSALVLNNTLYLPTTAGPRHSTFYGKDT